MRKIFFMFIASALFLSACATTSVNLGDDREYYSQDIKVCEQIKFECPEGTRPFSDMTGCGCEDIDDEKAVTEEGKDENATEEPTDEITEDSDESGEEVLEDEAGEEPADEAEEPETDSDGPIIIDGILLKPLEPINIGGGIDPDDIIDIQPKIIPIPIPDPLPQF